jgi:hypothetical protein
MRRQEYSLKKIEPAHCATIVLLNGYRIDISDDWMISYHSGNSMPNPHPTNKPDSNFTITLKRIDGAGYSLTTIVWE